MRGFPHKKKEFNFNMGGWIQHKWMDMWVDANSFANQAAAEGASDGAETKVFLIATTFSSFFVGRQPRELNI